MAVSPRLNFRTSRTRTDFRNERRLVARPSHASLIRSNYPINWLLMYSDLKHFGYNRYARELAALIREGKASRSHWWLMAPVVDFLIRHKLLLGRETVHQLKWLGLREDELRITLLLGAYDPPFRN
ncbi:MAG TPA: hypothetical protein VFY73_01920 [Ideonella sp.]|uniref:hypothetical protein n=1 Tax=Ideonella sp. TaxID=1929293 RepID=UPI002E320216|nr:hypothetical protein [Ideonella sp.]HEX5682765.1 hypothetical protein [Ideonella sp.]